MAKQRIGIIALCLWVLLCLTPLGAMAASTADAKEPIRTDELCTLALSYTCDGQVFSELPVKLYMVAEVSADFQYTLTEDFAGSGLILNGVPSQGEWNVIRTTLEAYILANAVEPSYVVATDELGVAQLTGLKPGMYLVEARQVTTDTLDCHFDSTLIALPGLGEDGLWQYQVSASPKPQILPPVTPDEDIQLKVLKLWRGDEGLDLRPRSIEVEIFRNGVRYETVTLSAENQWSYSWTAKNDGADWLVMERNIPDDYTVTVERRDTGFVLVNNYGPEDPTPIDPPKTGDTSNILAYMVPLYVSGFLLILLGTGRKRKRQ